MKLGIRHVRCFIAVAEQLHFRRAAARLGVAQPALSRTIRDLELELGVTLFDRSNRNVQITPAGQTFLSGCKGIITALEHTVEKTRAAHSGQLGALRIGYTDNAIAGPLPGILKAFQERMPGIVLRPHHDVTVSQLDKLERGKLDFGFVTGPISRSGFEQCLVEAERFVCVTYDTHPLAERSSIRLEELANENFVHGSSADWEHFHSYLIPLCRRAGFLPRIVQEAFNTAGILGLVECGMGITVLTENIRNFVGTNLVVLPISDVSEKLQTVAVWRSEPKEALKEHFVAFLRKELPAGLAAKPARAGNRQGT